MDAIGLPNRSGGGNKRQCVRFDKLDRVTLIKILRHYGYSPNPTVGIDTLAASVSNCFEGKKLQQDTLNEKEIVTTIISSFVEKCARNPYPHPDANPHLKKVGGGSGGGGGGSGGGGGGGGGYPTVTKWETGLTRSVANTIDSKVTWKSLNKLARGKANTLL